MLLDSEDMKHHADRPHKAVILERFSHFCAKLMLLFVIMVDLCLIYLSRKQWMSNWRQKSWFAQCQTGLTFRFHEVGSSCHVMMSKSSRMPISCFARKNNAQRNNVRLLYVWLSPLSRTTTFLLKRQWSWQHLGLLCWWPVSLWIYSVVPAVCVPFSSNVLLFMLSADCSNSTAALHI